MKLSDYLLDTAKVDWKQALATWSWLVPSTLSVWFVNKFGDVFVTLEDKSVHRINMDGGTLDRLADSRDDFKAKMEDEGNLNDWFLIGLVDELTSSGILFPSGKCYGFSQLPILGGGYETDNIRVFDLQERIAFLGDMYRQLSEIPDGTQVEIQWTE